MLEWFDSFRNILVGTPASIQRPAVGAYNPAAWSNNQYNDEVPVMADPLPVMWKGRLSIKR